MRRLLTQVSLNEVQTTLEKFAAKMDENFNKLFTMLMAMQKPHSGTGNAEDDVEKPSDFEDEHVKEGENHSSHPKVTKLQADTMDKFSLSVEKVDVVNTEQRRPGSVNTIGVFVSGKHVTKRDSIILSKTKPCGVLREVHHAQARKTETSSNLLKYGVCEHASLKSLGEVPESPLDTWVTVGRFSTSNLGVQALHTVGSCIYPKQGSPGKEKIIRLYYSVTMLQHVNTDMAATTCEYCWSGTLIFYGLLNYVFDRGKTQAQT